MAWALYEPIDTVKELDLFGFLPSDFEQEIDVWPENWPAVEIFLYLESQWHVAMVGATGLIYDSVFKLIDRKGYTGDAWWQVLDDVQQLERAAMKAMRPSET